MSEDQLRQNAIDRLTAKSHFWRLLAGWIVLSVVLVGIWFFTGEYHGGYFWPVWPIGGMAIGVVASGVRAFGSNPASNEDAIRREMDRMRGSRS